MIDHVETVREAFAVLDRHATELRGLYARFAAAWGKEAAMLIIAPLGQEIVRTRDTLRSGLINAIKMKAPHLAHLFEDLEP